jgi:hypothetical protein
MKTMEQHFDELEGLRRDALRKRIELKEFFEKFYDGMRELATMLKNNVSPKLGDAYSELSRIAQDAEQNPDLESIGKIGKMLGRYKTAALSAV